MNKSQLIKAVSEKSELSQKQVAETWSIIEDTILNTLSTGEKVQLSGFGTFETKDREARVGRNPHTKEAIDIPATRVPTFKASKALKDNVAK